MLAVYLKKTWMDYRDKIS